MFSKVVQQYTITVVIKLVVCILRIMLPTGRNEKQTPEVEWGNIN